MKDLVLLSNWIHDGKPDKALSMLTSKYRMKVASARAWIVEVEAARVWTLL